MKQLLLCITLLLLFTSCKFQSNPIEAGPQVTYDTVHTTLPVGVSIIEHKLSQLSFSIVDTSTKSGDAYIFDCFESYQPVASQLDSSFQKFEASFFDTATLVLFSLKCNDGDSLVDYSEQLISDSLNVVLKTNEWIGNESPTLLIPYQLCYIIKDIKKHKTVFTYDTVHTALPKGSTIKHYGLKQKFFDAALASQYLNKTTDAYIIDSYEKYQAIETNLDSSLYNLPETFFDSTNLALFFTERTGGDSIVSFEEYTQENSLYIVFKTAKYKNEGGFFPVLTIPYQIVYAFKKVDQTIYNYDTLHTILPVGIPLLTYGLKEHLFYEDKADAHLEKSLDGYIIDSYEKYTTMKPELDSTLQTLDPTFFDTKKLAIFSMVRTGGDKIVDVEHIRVDDSLSVILKTEKYKSDGGFFPILEINYQLVYAINKELEPLQKFRLENRIGDTLCYKRAFWDLPIERDTIKAFSIWTISKDTIIDGETLLIFEGVEYQESTEKIDTVLRRTLVRHSRYGVEITEFNLGFLGRELLSGPLRSIDEYSKLTFNQIRTKTLQLKGYSPQRVVDSNDVFQDHLYVLTYPLSKGLRWDTRDTTNEWGHLNIPKICHGFDTIQYRGELVQTIKTEKLINEGLNIDDVYFYQWYDSLGIIKSYIDYGPLAPVDSKTYYPKELFERIPFSEVDLSTLKPY